MFRKFDFLVFGSTQHMLRGCSCLCISDLEILFKRISGRSNAGVIWYSRIWVEEQRLRRGTRNKESRTARVKSTMFIVTYTIRAIHIPPQDYGDLCNANADVSLSLTTIQTQSF